MKTIGAYSVPNAVHAYIPNKMFRAMRAQDEEGVPADSPCGRDVQALFAAFALLEDVEDFHDWPELTTAQRHAYGYLAHMLGAEGYSIAKLSEHSDLAEAVARVAAVYIFG